MQRQLIQNFLNLPGVLGFSLIPLPPEEFLGDVYSIGFTHGDGPDDYPLLVEGMQEIIATTPAFLEFCEFQFEPYLVEVHKVDGEAVLLILREGERSDQYSKAVSELMQFIKADYPALVDSIQALKLAGEERPLTPASQLLTANLQDVVAAINSLSEVAARYLGTQLVANHWRTLQESDWLTMFAVDNNGTITVADGPQRLSPEQLADVRVWTQRFHQRCTRIIRDYDVLVEQALPQSHWQLLFGDDEQTLT